VQRYAREGKVPFDQTPGGHRRFNLDEVRAALGSHDASPSRAARRVVVLTALGLEHRAVCGELDSKLDRQLPNGTIFTEGDLAGESTDWLVAVAEIGEGNLGTAAEASAAIDFYKPDLILFVGVAGGLKSDIPRGSVVVASKVYQYQGGKDSDEILARPIAFPTDHALLQLALQVRRSDWDWEGEKPIVEVKPIAAGELVLANARSQTAEFIRRHFNDAAAADMESAGMYQAAQRSRGIPALAIRGISDMLDDKTATNDAEWQPRAARNAARFAVALLTRTSSSQLKLGVVDDTDVTATQIDNLLEQLPIPTAKCLRSVGVSLNVQWVRTLAEHSEAPSAALAIVREQVRSAVRPDPRWTLALAEYGVAHGLLAEARALMLEYADLVSDGTLAVVRAAMIAASQEDLEYARSLLDRALREARTRDVRAFAEMLNHVVDEDYEGAASAGAKTDPSDPFAQIVRSRAMVAVGKVREARDLVTRLIRDHPSATAGLMLEAAERLIECSMTLEPEEGELNQLQLAYELAVSARDQRRAWGGDSAAATVVAARAAGLIGDFRGVLSLVLEAPAGQATSREASSSELATMGCYAALSLSDFARTRQLLPRVSDALESQLIDLAVREGEGAPESELLPALEQLALIDDIRPDQLARVLSQLSRVGGNVEDGLARLEVASAELAALTRARIAILRGDTLAARRRLKGLKSSMAADLLADASLRDGRLDDLVERLRERFATTKNPSYLGEAAEHMLRAHRLAEARDLVVEALTVSGVGRAVRIRLEELAAQVYGGLQDWPNVERHTKELLALDSGHLNAAWGLVFALHNQRRFAEALNVIRSRSLGPRSEDEATCALVLWRQHDNGVEAIDAAVNIARTFPDSEQVVGLALLCSLELSSRLPEDASPSPDVTKALADLSDRFFTTWPESTIVTRLSADDPDELIKQMSEMVRRGTAPSDELVELAAHASAGRAPLGFVSAAVGKPLLELVLSAADRPVLIGSLDPVLRAQEDADALSALFDDVVVDVHAIAVVASLTDHAETLGSTFLRLRVPLNVLDDVLEGADRIGRRSTVSMSWDHVRDRMVIHEISQDDADLRATRAANACDVMRQMVSERVQLDEAFNAPRLGVVLAPIELARRRGIALWSDDPGLRVLARSEGVPAFGTLSVVDALTSGDRLSPLGALQLKLSLLSAGFDFDASTDLLLRYLTEDEFGTSAVGILARRSVWTDPGRGLAVFKASLAAAPTENLDLRRELIAGAAFGAASAVIPNAQATVLVAVGLSALFESDDQRSAFPGVLDAMRKAATALRLDDPLPKIVNRLVDMFQDDVAPEIVPRLVLHIVSAANEDDRRAAAELLLR
jgi:nucleoside phosphorylase